MIKKRNIRTDWYYIPNVRIGISMVEFIFLFIYGIYGGNDENKQFLLSSDHGFYILIPTCVFYLIYTQYIILFPNFSLPLGVNARSKWGCAYSNELSELKKMKVIKGNKRYEIGYGICVKVKQRTRQRTGGPIRKGYGYDTGSNK